MKKAWASDELARLSVTGLIHTMAKPSQFDCQLCRRDVSVLNHRSFEILRHYQRAQNFATEQRFRFETSGWRVLDFSGSPLPDEVERQRARIMRTPLVRRDRDYLFRKDLITDDARVVDPQLPILAKVSSLLELLRQGGSY